MIAIGQTARKGRGVFALKPYAAGALLEEAPVVVVPAAQVELLLRTSLAEYYFEWGASRDEAAIVLGACALCNHSYLPNAVYARDLERRTIAFIALREIATGDEVTINYNHDPKSRAPLKFDVLE